MLRRIAGYALLAVVFVVALKIAFGLFGLLIGLAVATVTLAVFGYVVYLGLALLSPDTARKFREAITGPRRPPTGVSGRADL